MKMTKWKEQMKQILLSALSNLEYDDLNRLGVDLQDMQYLLVKKITQMTEYSEE